jgi:hypothetical protein
MEWANQGALYSFQCAWEVLFDSTWEAIPLCKGWVQHWKPTEANKPNGFIAATVPPSVVGSYGEKIAIQITETPPGTSWLTVTSNSNIGLVDFGKNRRNVSKLIKAVNAVLAGKGIETEASPAEAVAAADAYPKQRTAAPGDADPHEVPASLCPQCGTVLKPGAQFCGKCGNKTGNG